MMKERENEIDNLFQTNADQFEMAPPKKAWASLDAELDKMQAVLYKRNAFRYKLVSIGLSLILISFITFHYFVPQRNNNKSLAAGTNEKADSFQPNNAAAPDTKLKYTSKKNNTVSEAGSRMFISANENTAVTNSNKTSRSSKPENTVKDDNPSEFSSVSNKSSIKGANRSTTLISSSENKMLINARTKSNSPVFAEKNNEHDIAFANNTSIITAAAGEDKKENIINRRVFTQADVEVPAAKGAEAQLILKGDGAKNNGAQNILDVNAASIPFGQQKTPADLIKADPKSINSSAENSKAFAEVQNENTVKLQPAAITKTDSLVSNNAAAIRFQKHRLDFSKFAIAAFFSPDFNCHLLFDNDVKVPNHHKDHSKAKDFDERELPDFSFTAGALLKYDLTNKWSIQSGCTYSSSVRKIKPSTIYAEQGSDLQAHYLLKSSLGITELPNAGGGTPLIGDSVNLKTNSKQILQFINVPIIVRFQYVKKRFSYYAFAGLSANILIREQSEVSIENPTSETIIISNIEGVKKLTFGFLTGIGAGYNFYKGISVFAEPVFRASITSINQNTSVTSYPCTFGVNTGLTYHF